MRRVKDSWMNATQILRVANVDKGRRTKVLEKEILTGEHEKVQGGYGKYQGTWVNYKRGRDFCRSYGVEDILRPLLDYEVAAGNETPTKEQAMAANRKRFYNSSLDGRPGNGPMSNGTFFQNISPTTSVALAAMNKAARINSPVPRPLSVSQRPSITRHPSHQEMNLQGSQQSMASQSSYVGDDSGYSTQPNGEPPRKRVRRESQEGMAPPSLPVDVSMRSLSPTEPNESFMYEYSASQEHANPTGEPVASAPLPSPSSEEETDKMNLILDLFAEQGKIDYSQHPALKQLSGEDFNVPLDASANNALHWAATLAKVPLLKMLIQKGANIRRGNAAGQSPLIAAVIVNNCWEQSCFPELLELLSPLIELRDVQGRTVLHHIAVSSGIKGRAPSSKYYLEALLEFLVRIGTQSHPAKSVSASTAAAAAVANMTSQSNGDLATSSQDPALVGSVLTKSQGAVSLVRFLSHIVNARDKAGNTALNLVARIGNRSIIQQLLEIHADPSLPNHKGVSAKDFGVGIDPGEEAPPTNGFVSQRSVQHFSGTHPENGHDPATAAVASQAEELGQNVIACVYSHVLPCDLPQSLADKLTAMTSLLTQNLSSHRDILRQRSDEVDQLNEQLRELSNAQKIQLDQVQELQSRVKLREERQARIKNLQRAIEEHKKRLSPIAFQYDASAGLQLGAADSALIGPEFAEVLDTLSASDNSMDPLVRIDLSALPPLPQLQLIVSTYTANNAALKQKADELHSRSSELEGLYRRVVSLCTGVQEDKVLEALPNLVAAVESEQSGAFNSGGDGDVTRVREFLKRVEGGNTVGHNAGAVEV